MPRKASGRATTSRKQQHVEITLTKDVRFRRKSTGFERLEFIHNALPEINLADVDTSTEFLGRRISLPLLISSMTGGYAHALVINRHLAEVCESHHIAMGVGSQRQALENRDFHRTFTVVREVAPSIPVIGNIGAAEVARLTSADPVQRLIDLVHADGFAVHLNPLQEFLQPEGSPAFRGVLDGIAMLVHQLPVPVIVKEIGAGLSSSVVRRLYEAGVRHIDIAGAGGTSWAGVEAIRREDRAFGEGFWDWGIPTVEALRQAAALRSEGLAFTMIASGGIVSGFDVAKSIALGADIAASARPMLTALHEGGRKKLNALIARWSEELRGVMFLTGSTRIADLRSAPLVPASAQ